LTGEFILVNTVDLINITQYTDIALAEATIYYYKINAIDDAQLTSEFSEIAFGKTLYGPRKPQINNSVRDFKIPEDSYDDSTINLFNWFKDLNNDPLVFRCVGQEYITVTIFQENGTVTLKPDENWNGKEELTFYAKDRDGEVEDSVTVTVTAVNDPPGPARIISFDDNIKIKAGEKLDFEATCDDPDLIYGDALVYKWSSSISGEIGRGKVIVGVDLKPGKHVITLEVIDSDDARCYAMKNVTVQKRSEQSTDQSTILIISLALIVIIILIIIILLNIRKRKSESEIKSSPPGDLPGGTETDQAIGVEVAQMQPPMQPIPMIMPMPISTPGPQPPVQSQLIYQPQSIGQQKTLQIPEPDMQLPRYQYPALPSTVEPAPEMVDQPGETETALRQGDELEQELESTQDYEQDHKQDLDATEPVNNGQNGESTSTKAKETT
jgi:hypothetical protein